jgi:hypothetical protein
MTVPLFRKAGKAGTRFLRKSPITYRRITTDTSVEAIANVIERVRGTAVNPSQAAATGPRYLTTDEAAVMLRLSPRTLEKRRVNGGGPRYRKFGRRVLYALDDLESWANERRFENTGAHEPYGDGAR